MAGKFNLEFDDIQGFVVRGFGHLGYAGYALISISDVGRFQSWMEGELGAGSFTPASVRKQTAGLRGAIGFSATGLDKVAGSYLDADMLPPEFLEGMVQEHRSRLLSDVNENDPGKWRWGSNEDDAIDGAVMLFAADSSAVDAWLDAAVSDANGMRQIIRLRGHFLADKKEPFGFADGISQPIIDGTERAKRARAENPSASNFHVVSAGELILGYEDGSGKLPRTPAIRAACDPGGLLRPHWERPEQRDFGRNGSFVVIRQMAQDVGAFSKFVTENTPPGGDPDVFAAKLVGREKDGTPITLGDMTIDQNDFDY